MRMDAIVSSTRLRHVVVLALLLTTAGCHVGNGWVLNRSGMRQYKKGHYAKARNRFARAIAHNPCNPDFRHNLAMALQKQGDVQACERILRYNLTIDAMHQPTYHSLAQVLVMQGRTPEAQELLAGWVATQPYVPESNIEMAWLQRETGDVAGAEQSLQNALRADPTNPVALSHLGQLYHTSGQSELAAAYYQRSLASNWDQPEVQSRLSTLIDPSSMTRSAMMQNPPTMPLLAQSPVFAGDPMLAGSPMPAGMPMMVNAPMTEMMPGTPMMAASSPLMMDNPFGSDPQAMALENPKFNPQPKLKRRRHDRENESVIASYPLPTYDSQMTGWQPASPMMSAPTMATLPTDMAGFAPPLEQPITTANLSPMLPPADPAHLSPPEMTASLPVVDPH